MALRETTHTANSDLFRQALCNIINLRHPIRLMVGLQRLKHTCNVSDEEVVATCSFLWIASMDGLGGTGFGLNLLPKHDSMTVDCSQAKLSHSPGLVS